MRPSLFTLFTRGRYSRPSHHTRSIPGKTISLSAARNEAERFTAAAIAFTWRHDPRFRNHFWKSVCVFEGDPKLTDNAEILVEPYRWADLLITNPTERKIFVYVVELKLHAPLSDTQNPSKREFGLGEGYGGLLNANFGFPGEKLRFVLLGAKPVVLRGRPWTLPIRVQQRSWEDLADQFPKSSVSKDLAISLGMLGIDAFPAAEVKNMKVDTRKNELAKAESILREVERRISWPRGRSKPAGFGFEKGHWYLGVELLTASKGSAKSLSRLVRPSWADLGWFGYQGEEGGPPSLAVWLYCGTDGIRKKIAANLSGSLKGCSVDATTPPVEKEFYLIVSARRHTLNNDCDWFCNVLTQLGVKTSL